MVQYVPWDLNKAASRQLHTGTKEVLYELDMSLNVYNLCKCEPNDYIHTPLKAHEQDRLQRRKYPLEGRHTFDVALGANKLRWLQNAMGLELHCAQQSKLTVHPLAPAYCVANLCVATVPQLDWPIFQTHTSGSSVKLSRAWVFSSLSAQVVEK